MKYAILVPDGAADYPLEQLKGKTPLQAAYTPNMDFLAKKGKLGRAQTIPQGFLSGSDVANLSILGYDPKKYYIGRGPLEAAYHGIELKENQWAFRCNLVTIIDDKMVDYSAGHITTQEAEQLINHLQENLGTKDLSFFLGVSYRHLTIFTDGFKDLKCSAPHDITGEEITQYLPQGGGSQPLRKLINDSRALLEDHPINVKRRAQGKNPANSIWLWGQGYYKAYPSFTSLHNICGSVISAVDLLKGIARMADMKVIEVPGATGYYDTDYQAKAQYGLKALEENDLVFIHVEAPDEAGHVGDIQQKIKSIEDFDKKIVNCFLDKNVLLLPDHYTPISSKTHGNEPVPFLISGQGVKADNTTVFSEEEAKKGLFGLKPAHELIYLLLNKEDL
ncbi:MAG: cofactor-independent phosphoglycerate mutase [Actinobacteria bacterium]|nr:MAG: cofactor-independent phosphoglycerate mutase [Actinomycetota bacterium]